MRPLLAVDESPALVPLLLSTIALLGTVIAVLFWQLLKSKDEKVEILKEVGKDYTADKVADQAAMTTITGEVRRVTEALDIALGERDKIVRDAMDLLRDIDEKIADLRRTVAALERKS